MSTSKSKHHKESKYISNAFGDPSPILSDERIRI